MLGALAVLARQYPWYAPGRFLGTEYEAAAALAPRPLQAAAFQMVSDSGTRIVVEISAVLVPVSRTRAAVMFGIPSTPPATAIPAPHARAHFPKRVIQDTRARNEHRAGIRAFPLSIVAI